VYKKLLPLFIISLLLGCYDKKKESDSLDQVTSILNHIDSLSNTEKIYALRRVKNIELASDSTKTVYFEHLASAYVTEKKYDSAIVYFQKVIAHIEQPIDSEKEAIIYYKLWDLYKLKGELGNQITTTTDLEEQLSPTLEIGLVHLNYLKQINNEASGKYKDAFSNNTLRIQLLKKIVQQEPSNTVYKERLRLALLDRSHLSYLYLGDKKRAFTTLDSLVKIQDLTPNTAQLLYTNFGAYTYLEGNKEASLDLYKKGVNAMKKLDKNAFDVPNTMTVGYANIAEVLIDLKNYEVAKKYLDTLSSMGIHTFEEGVQRSVLKYQLRLQVASNGRYGNAITLLDTISKYQDNAYRKKFSKELVSLTQAKEKQQELLLENQKAEFEKKRFTAIAWYIGIIALLGISLFIWLRRYKEKQKELHMQQRLLRAQMNPHFSVNALYSIQSLIKTDSTLAIKYLNSFSKLLRLVLENSMVNYVPLEDELESIKQYIELQQLRFPERFTYEIVLKDTLSEESNDIPSMLIQPFIENAIEHGFAGISYTGMLLITLSRKHKKLFCTIEDNGRGLQHKSVSKKSASIQLITNFISKKTGSTVLIKENTTTPTKTGVLVSFQLPFKSYTDD
jgi:tetratricopeptide (TPR) repeat protein